MVQRVLVVLLAGVLGVVVLQLLAERVGGCEPPGILRREDEPVGVADDVLVVNLVLEPRPFWSAQRSLMRRITPSLRMYFLVVDRTVS